MKLTEKTFEIKQLTENKSEFVINETLYYFGISWYYCYHSESGDIPFSNYFSAEEKMKKLIKKEKTEVLIRESNILFTFVVIILITIFSYGFSR